MATNLKNGHAFEGRDVDSAADYMRHLNEKKCRRCGGLMIVDHCMDLDDETGQIVIGIRKCLQCGEVIDPTILKNRAFPGERIPIRSTARRSWPIAQGLAHQKRKHNSKVNAT